MIKTNYFTYTGNAFDALMGRNGTLVDSVFFQAYGENGALAKKAGTLFGMVGAGYDIKTLETTKAAAPVSHGGAA